MFSYRVRVLVRPKAFKRNLTNLSPSFSIPVVNFAKFRTPSSLEEKKGTAFEIVSAFKECGFVYLSNHGISPCESYLLIPRRHITPFNNSRGREDVPQGE